MLVKLFWVQIGGFSLVGAIWGMQLITGYIFVGSICWVQFGDGFNMLGAIQWGCNIRWCNMVGHNRGRVETGLVQFNMGSI